MNDRDITVLLKKADELRSLFVLGQRVIPFLEEIFVFVSEIQPLLDEINVSIEENLKKMPNASKQLSKVTEATELATTEIMDIVDGVVGKTDKMGKNLADLQSFHTTNVEKSIKLLSIVRDGLKNKSANDDAIPELDTAIKNLEANSKEQGEKLINETNDIIQSISMDSSSIMMSLQVQDITSQQIAAVNNLLETVQKKLVAIMNRFQNSDFSELVPEENQNKRVTNVSKMHREIAFDPDAVDSISLKHERQTNVDQYISEHNSEDEDDGPTTQDDIDAMFNNTSNIDSKDESDTTPDISDDEELSPDDIDKMFGNNDDTQEDESNDDNVTEDDMDDNTEFSQDDIDKMFNS
jgi:chemotaxis regulatin CheY-phosphate phosphatase CheZ